MRNVRLYFCIGFLAALVFGAAGFPAGADDWAKIPPEEMALKDSPTHPGAHAIVLYREEQADDSQFHIRFYKRVKILTEEGRKFADIELPFLKQLSRISDIKARTVRPDGSTVEFKGEVFEKTVAKTGRIKFLAKTFTLPEVQVGSIIEYRWKEQWDETIPTLRWTLQDDIPTLHAFFARKPISLPGLRLSMQWISVGLPQGTNAKEDPKDKWIKLDLRNIAPFEEEEFMPPRNEVSMRVDFYYLDEIKSEAEYWRDVGKTRYQQYEDFIGKHGDIAREAAAVAPPGEPAEVRLRKLYARAQKIRNISYERKSEKEAKREKLKDNNNAKDVLKNGYGTPFDVDMFFAALARGAGFDASVVNLSRRDSYFFRSLILDSRQMNDLVVLVKAEGKEYFLEPAIPFAPFGLLSWPQTGVRGMRVLKDGGEFVTSPQPDSSFATVERTAKLKLADDGSLEGDLVVQFTGQAALSRRLDTYDEDAEGRRKEIEDEVKGWLPTGAKVTIKNILDWESTDKPLRVECTLNIAGLATSTGRRILVPPAVFHSGRAHPFQHAKRIHAVYFNYPYREVDNITLELPEGFKVEGTPRPRDEQSTFATFKAASQADGGALKFERRFAMEGFFFRADYYNTLRSFYDRVRTADEERVVLRSGGTN